MIDATIGEIIGVAFGSFAGGYMTGLLISHVRKIVDQI